jgi:DNA-binding MarR family transcriptional regulator
METGESPEFFGCVAGNLRAATRAVTRIYDDALRDSGLRITQLAVLVQIERLQPVSVIDLAAALSTERSSMAREITTLERDGLVRVAVDKADRRARAIRITADGRRRLRKCAPAWQAAQQRMRATLGADRLDQLVAIVGDLVDAIAAEDAATDHAGT